jgi:hypothetical protein
MPSSPVVRGNATKRNPHATMRCEEALSEGTKPNPTAIPGAASSTKVPHATENVESWPRVTFGLNTQRSMKGLRHAP